MRVEEVHAREAEIARLHHGWDAVESRWREAVALMRGWRERLADGSDTLRIEDLGAGLELGEEAVRRAVGERERFGNSPVRGEEIVGMRQARRSGSSVANSSMLSAEEEQRGEEQAQDASGLYPEDQERSAKEARVLRDDTASPARQKSQVELDVDLGIALLPTPAALRPIASNARRSSPRAQRQVAWRENSPIAGAFLDALGNSDEDDGPDVDEIAMLDGASEVKEVRSFNFHDLLGLHRWRRSTRLTSHASRTHRTSRSPSSRSWTRCAQKPKPRGGNHRSASVPRP